MLYNFAFSAICFMFGSTFQMLDPFLANCRVSAKYLVEITRDLAAIDAMPESVRETRARIEQHSALIEHSLEQQTALTELRERGEDTLTGLKEYVVNCCGDSQEYRCVVTS